jgi:hypothetical protein
MCRCINRKNIVMGIKLSTLSVMKAGQFVVYSPTDLVRLQYKGVILRRYNEHARRQKIVPYPNGLENAHSHQDRSDQWDDDPPVHPNGTTAVDTCRLDYLVAG